MVRAWKSNRFVLKPPSTGVKSVLVASKSEPIDRGVVQQLSLDYDPYTDYESGVTDSSKMSGLRPILTLSDPVWHSAIHSLIITHRTIPANTPTAVGSNRFAYAPIALGSSDHTFAMPDPTDPTKLKSSYSGIFKIIATMGDNDDLWAILDTTVSQPRWRYEITENSQAPDSTTAKLLNLDGTTFADSIELEDPDSVGNLDQTGHKGFCHHAGNKFYIATGPC